MMHLVEVGVIHVDSALTIEFTPDDLSNKYALLIDHERIPTYNEYQFACSLTTGEPTASGGQARWDGDGEFLEWFIDNDAVANRTGRWIVTIITMNEELNSTDLTGGKFDKSKLKSQFNGNFFLRTFHSGCYYFNRKQRAWVADGVKVYINILHFLIITLGVILIYCHHYR
jgi:hypothetical protein